MWGIKMGVFKVAESNIIITNRFGLGLNCYEDKQCETSYLSYDSFPAIAELKLRWGEDKRRTNEDQRKKNKDSKTINEDKRTKK